MKYYYGISHMIILAAAIEAVIDVFPAKNRARTEQMLVGTAAAETMLGTFKDSTPTSHGVGVMQMDKIAFDDVVARTRKTTCDTCIRRLGIDINKVQYEELADCPVLSVLFARLFYMLIPDEFPDTTELQAAYWKKHYNTSSGKGTEEDYIQRGEAAIKKFETYLESLEEGLSTNT